MFEKIGIIGISLIVCMIIYGTVINPGAFADKRTPEQKAIDSRNDYLAWHANEAKYCNSKQMELNDTYSINGCQYIQCLNSTGAGTYEICSNKNNEAGAFAGGLLVGWLAFSK